PRPNGWWVDAEGAIREAFLRGHEEAGDAAPVPRPAPEVATFEAFERRWQERKKTLAQAVAAAVPLFDRPLAEEAVLRAGLDPEADPSGAGEDERRRLFEAARALMADL